MAKAGWNPAKVQFALLIDEKGTLLDILRLKEKGYRGKKKWMFRRLCYCLSPLHGRWGLKQIFWMIHPVTFWE